jgi:Uma2 family endonuclease
MTTKPKPATESVAATVGSDVERTGAICLRLESLGIDHQADDFPAQFIEFCEQNNLYEMEVNAQGELIILPMTGHRGNRHESYLNHFLTGWEIEHGGVASSQSSRYRLPSGEIRGPDAAWITQERYDALPEQQRLTIIEGAPDFVAEIRSRTDNLAPLQRKMGLWMAGGVRLGWLIDPENRRVYVYRQAQPEPETLEDPETLDGGDVLVGFSFPVRQYVFDLQ